MIVFLAVLAVAAAPPPSAGVAKPRFDVTLFAERMSQQGTDTDDFTGRSHTVAGVGGYFGYQWHDRHRTEVGVGRTGTAYEQEQYWVSGGFFNPAFVSHRYRHTHVSVAHLISFRRNTWVSPQIGIGVMYEREARESYLEPLLPEYEDGDLYPGRADRERALAAHPSRTEGRIRPFGVAAFKVYFTRRAFVRAGARLAGAAPGQYALTIGLGGDW